MVNFVYKETKARNMKLVGILDTDTGVITVDGEEKVLLKSLADFNGCEVTITAKMSSDEELEDPSYLLDED